jgi:halogenation protein CepH
LSRAGFSVALIEKHRFPRYQIGESLLPATIHGVCKLLGVDRELQDAGFVRKTGGTFLWGRSERPWTFDFGSGGVNLSLDFSYSYQVERARFDAILLDNARRAGVEVVEECSALEVLRDAGRVRGVRVSQGGGERSLAARWVVDASGAQSSFHRAAGERVFSRFFQNVAVFGYFEGASRLPPPNRNNIFCCAFPQGWFWYIPLSDTLTSVGAVVGREHAGRLQSGAQGSLRGFIEQCPRIEALLASGRPITDGMYGVERVRKDYSYCNTRFWTPGLALIGDAACFVDPVFSTGVHLATWSGMLVARSIATALRGDLPEETCMNLFERSYRAEFAAFHDFLVGFYDLHQDEEAYFWKARKALNSDDAANQAFLQLVAGAGTTAGEFTRLRSRTADILDLQIRMRAGESDVSDMENLLAGMEEKTAQFVFRNHQQRQSTVGQLLLQAHGGRADQEEDVYRVSADGLFWQVDDAPRFLGQYLLRRGLITPEQLDAALETQRELGRPQARPLLGELLVELHHLSASALAGAIELFHEELAGSRFDPLALPAAHAWRSDLRALVLAAAEDLRARSIPVKIESPREFYGFPPVADVACECTIGGEGRAVFLAQTDGLSRATDDGSPGSFLERIVGSADRALGREGRRLLRGEVAAVGTPAATRPFLDALMWRIDTPTGLALLVVGVR